MTITNFSGDEDKDEISPREWLRLVKEYFMRIGINHFLLSFSFSGEVHKWWRTLDEDIRFHSTWEEFEKIVSNKWIRDTKMEEMYRIKDELK
jgi:hypothetical protein